MKQLALIFILFFTLVTEAQVNTQWEETYGGTGTDEAKSVIELRDGNLLVVGFTDSEGSGKKDGYAVKISPSGDMIWDATFGGPKNDILYDVVELDNGDLAFAGETESMGKGKYDFWLVITDDEGAQKWEETYGGPKDDGAHNITYTFDKKLVLSGYTKSRGAGNRDFWVIKIDQDGEGKDRGKIIWARNAGGKSADFVSAVKQAPYDSAYYVLGTTNSFGNGSGDAWMIRILDERGRVKGKKYLGDKRYEYGNDFCFTDEQGFFVVGATSSWTNGLFDGYVMKLNNEYDSWYIKHFGGEKDDKFNSVVRAGNSYIVAGYTQSKGEGGADGWLMKITDKGVAVWQETLGDTKTDKFVKIIKLHNGNFVAVGSTDSQGEGKMDFWVVNFTTSK